MEKSKCCGGKIILNNATGDWVCSICRFLYKDLSDLDERFTGYYNSQQRVEVTWEPGFEDYTGYGCRTEGRKARFYVGRSTGWRPVYLMIYRRDSIEGPAILSCAVKSTKGLGIYRYQK